MDNGDVERKFVGRLFYVALVVLGLSVQFSPTFGLESKWLLVSAWALLFLSAVAGGWQLRCASASLFTKVFGHVQIWTLVAAVAANLAFASINYLWQTPHCDGDDSVVNASSYPS